MAVSLHTLSSITENSSAGILLNILKNKPKPTRREGQGQSGSKGPERTLRVQVYQHLSFHTTVPLTGEKRELESG